MLRGITPFPESRARELRPGKLDGSALPNTLREYGLLASKEGVSMVGQAVPLAIVDVVFVPDERKAEIRRRLKRARGQVDGILESCVTQGIKAGPGKEIYEEFLDVIYRTVR